MSNLDYLLNGDGNDTTPEGFTAQQNEGTTNEASTQEATNEASNEAIARAITDLLSKHSHSGDKAIAEAITQLLKKYNRGNNQTSTNTRVFELFSQGEYLKDMTPTECLIDKWIQDGALHVMFGASGSFKSFCVIDMCEHIACNDFETWCGNDIEHGEVVYLVGEGSKAIKKRFFAWCLEHDKNPDDIPLYITPTSFFLDDTTSERNVDSLIADIRAVCSNPKLIVVDTLRRYMNGEENSSTDMNKIVFACTKLIEELGCAVILIHHSGLAQEAKGRGRGSGSLYAAIDIEIHCIKSGMSCTLEQTKNKDNGVQKPLSFNMKEVEIPGLKNKKGMPVRETSLVPIFNMTQTEALATAEPEPQKKEKTPKTSIHYKRGVKTFKEAAIRYGRLSSNEAGESFIDVELEEWRKVAYEIIESSNTDSAKRSAFNRAKQELIEEAEPPILSRYENEEGTFYRLSRNGENEAAFRVETFAAVIRRIEEAKLSAKTNATGGADAGDTTQNLF